jgi:Holliday junction resolvasome RuvABC endonuclease subunit
MATRRQLGLDPGYGRLGYAVVEERGSQWQLPDAAWTSCLAAILPKSQRR